MTKAEAFADLFENNGQTQPIKERTTEMEKLNLIDLKPADTPDYMIPAWLGCISFASRQPGALEQFRADTGCNWEPGKTGIDRMIDEATGREQDFVREFVLWVNRNVWGAIGASDD